MVRRTRLIPILGALVLGACSMDDMRFSDEQSEVLQDKLVVFSSQEADSIEVGADRITLPAAQYEHLLGRKDGDVLASDRGSAAGTNPTGFLRAFKSAALQGDRIVIMTGPAVLTDVVRRGKVKTVLPSSAPVTPKSHGEPLGQSRQAIAVDESVVISVPSKTIPVKIGGKTVDLSVGGDLTIKKAALNFDPDFDIGLEIDWFKVKEFHAIANGKLATELDVEGSASVSWDHSVTDKESADAVEKAIKEAVESGSKLSQAKPIASASIPLPTWFVGPVPVVTDLNFELDLSCGFSVEGSVTAAYKASTNSSFSAGLRYEDEQFSPVSATTFKETHQGPDFTLGGGVGFSCSLKPTLQLRFYGAIGPYLFLDVYGGIDASLKTECGAQSGSPNCSIGVTASAGAKGGVGAKIDIGVLGVTFRQDLGELQLFDLKLLDDQPILGPLDLGACPLGHCGGATPACGDGTCAGGESCSSCEADCGSCPASCGDGTCDSNEDCSNCASDCGDCPASCGDGFCNGSESCSSCPADCGGCGTCSWGSSGENGDSCVGVPSETWRCVKIPSWGMSGSQVCRVSSYCPTSDPCWVTYHLDPSNCSACCGDYDAGCE